MDFIEFRNYALECDRNKSCFSAFAATPAGRLLPVLTGGTFFSEEGKRLFFESCESAPDPLFTGKLENLFWLFRFKFRDSSGKKSRVTAETVIFDDRIEIRTKGGTLHFSGTLKQGRTKSSDLLAMRSFTHSEFLQGASGPAIPQGADLLYNRKTDCALKFSGACHLSFDWKKKNYRLEGVFSKKSPLILRFEKDAVKNKLALKHWKGISYDHGFNTPPVGWMTWYAVRFDACEQIVLENAAAMKELFGRFNDKMVIWVDWEWCHKKMFYHSEEGVDALNCRKEAYPRGMKFVSDKIKKMGLIPALWTGATCDGNINEYFRENPGFCLADVLNWAGRYWADLSHPGVQEEYIPAVFRNLLSWGYEMIKWDCLLNTMRFNDQFREKRYAPGLSTDEALHRVVAAGRKVLGDKFYLLGCTGMERATMAAVDLFDACRIGGDVFSWEDFKSNAVTPIFSYFPLHNTAIYLDPDTLVLRSEYSTLEQARSRISLFALTGMQFTLGDPVKALDGKRIDALKRAMPTTCITPQEICRRDFTGDTACVMVSIARPWETWYVAGIFNLTGEKQKCRVKLDSLPPGEYTVFEFWCKKFYGTVKNEVEVELPPGGCAVLRLTPFKGLPQLAGTSRHLLQGAVELKNYTCDTKTGSISGSVETVEGDDMELFFHLPENFVAEKQQGLKIQKGKAVLTIPAECSGVVQFQVKYKEVKK